MPKDLSGVLRMRSSAGGTYKSFFRFKHAPAYIGVNIVRPQPHIKKFLLQKCRSVDLSCLPLCYPLFTCSGGVIVRGGECIVTFSPFFIATYIFFYCFCLEKYAHTGGMRPTNLLRRKIYTHNSRI